MFYHCFNHPRCRKQIPKKRFDRSSLNNTQDNRLNKRFTRSNGQWNAIRRLYLICHVSLSNIFASSQSVNQPSRSLCAGRFLLWRQKTIKRERKRNQRDDQKSHPTPKKRNELPQWTAHEYYNHHGTRRHHSHACAVLYNAAPKMQKLSPRYFEISTDNI